MSKQYPGGLITKTPVTPSGPYANSTAPGVWTLEQQAYWQKLGQWPTQGAVNPDVFIENLFSTYLYTGTGVARTITNGIDLSTKGGLTWIKSRDFADNHNLFDTTRGAGKYLVTNATNAQATDNTRLSAFTTSGFSLGTNGAVNGGDFLYASWTFRKQPKFFDVVTYTGNGTAGRQIAHNLGSVPGVIIVKCTDTAGEPWYVYHRSLGATKYLTLNSTNAAVTSDEPWYNTEPTSTNFTVAQYNSANGSGKTYVAYLFAHNAGGFGLTGTDNVISCGSFTKSSGVVASISLGYEPQWLLFKRTDASENWFMIDNMRGMTMSTDAYLIPNLSNAEANLDFVTPTATGFEATNNFNNGTYIYIAIRRGPMKVPTSGTSVFSPVAYTGDGGSPKAINAGFVGDAAWGRGRTDTFNWNQVDRLRGSPRLSSNATSAEATSIYGNPTWDTMTGLNGVNGGTDNSNYNQSSMGYIFDVFKRAPSFFDVVCYTGTGSARTVTHNLGVVPELMIIRRRNSAGMLWVTYAASQGNTKFAYLNSDQAFATDSYLSNTTPTSSVFTVGTNGDVNASGGTYVAYLFATCAGVSKVGSYTGTGAAQTINCGFTAGSRFVMIKRTDSTGDWYVWDSARGIIPSNDPYLLINSTAAEVTGTDYVDTTAVGFDVTSTAPAAINANGGTFIFLAIA